MYQAFYRGSESLAYPIFALAIFFTFFVGTFVWAYWPRRGRSSFDERAALPLFEDDHEHR